MKCDWYFIKETWNEVHEMHLFHEISWDFMRKKRVPQWSESPGILFLYTWEKIYFFLLFSFTELFLFFYHTIGDLSMLFKSIPVEVLATWSNVAVPDMVPEHSLNSAPTWNLHPREECAAGQPQLVSSLWQNQPQHIEALNSRDVLLSVMCILCRYVMLVNAFSFWSCDCLSLTSRFVVHFVQLEQQYPFQNQHTQATEVRWTKFEVLKNLNLSST